MKAIKGLLAILLFIPCFSASAQSFRKPEGANLTVPRNWHMLDHKSSGFWGASVNKVYNTINLPARDTIVVAVIDGGVDIHHPDLAGKIWKNDDETPGNAVDDDHNGYVDDIHGWSFLGSDSADIQHENKELTRQYRVLKNKYSGANLDSLSEANYDGYLHYIKLKKRYDKALEKLNKAFKQFNQVSELYKKARQYFASRTGVQKPGRELVASLEVEKKDNRILREFYLYALENDLAKGLKDSRTFFEQELNYAYNLEFTPRELVGDDITDPHERYYGNTHVKGPNPAHGTQVAGVIAANRENATGTNGIADAVKIMPVRAVPMGDERDKDVANAIRYAVDNGARIINMSFSKTISPHENVVEEAINYGARQDVLFVHSAGSHSLDIDDKIQYPNDHLETGGSLSLAWLEVGAHFTGKEGKFKLAPFTNYGKHSVDLFAPGKDVYTTTAYGQYTTSDGTSIAAPVVSGVAAMVWSRYPDMPATELKEILVDSRSNLRGHNVFVPGMEDKTKKLRKLSGTGGAVNAYAAMKRAGEWKKKR